MAGLECPGCGTTKNRTANIFDSDAGTSHERLDIKATKVDERKPYRLGKYGDDLHRDSGTWSEIFRTIDREQNTYDEVIVNSDGDVVREVHEKLAEHRGRGSAKNKRPSAV